jgi:hypothetical protein
MPEDHNLITHCILMLDVILQLPHCDMLFNQELQLPKTMCGYAYSFKPNTHDEFGIINQHSALIIIPLFIIT